MSDQYDLAAQRWANGMRNAQPYIRARQKAQAEVAKRNRANGKPCGIEGCKYKVYKGALCRKHWDIVPWQSKLALSMACINAQIQTASEHHELILTELRERLAA